MHGSKEDYVLMGNVFFPVNCNIRIHRKYFDARGIGTAFYSGTLCAKTAREEIFSEE